MIEINENTLIFRYETELPLNIGLVHRNKCGLQSTRMASAEFIVIYKYKSDI